MNDNWTVIHLSGRPMALDKTLESGQVFRWRKRRDPKWGDHYEGVIYGNLVRIKQDGDKLLFTSCPTPGPQFKDRLERYLGLDDDLESIYAELRRPDGPNGPIARAIKKFYGMRMLRQEQWECLATFILTPQNKIDKVKQSVELISSAFGQPIPGTNRKASPSADAIARAGESALLELALPLFNKNKLAKRLAATAKKVAHFKIISVFEEQVRLNKKSGKALPPEIDDLLALKVAAPYDYALEIAEIFNVIDLSEIGDAPYDYALKISKNGPLKLPGVGDKVANCVLLMSMDKLEAFPVDTHVEDALWRWYPHELEKEGIPRPIPGKASNQSTIRKLRKWAQNRFGQYAGYAQQYLFEFEMALKG